MSLLYKDNKKLYQVQAGDSANKTSSDVAEELIKYIKFHSKRDLMENKRVFYAGAKFMFQLHSIKYEKDKIRNELGD